MSSIHWDEKTRETYAVVWKRKQLVHFPTCISKKIITRDSDLRKLLNIGKYYIPVLEVSNCKIPEYMALGLYNKEILAAMKMEVLRDHVRAFSEVCTSESTQVNMRHDI